MTALETYVSTGPPVLMVSRRIPVNVRLTGRADIVARTSTSASEIIPARTMAPVKILRVDMSVSV